MLRHVLATSVCRDVLYVVCTLRSQQGAWPRSTRSHVPQRAPNTGGQLQEHLPMILQVLESTVDLRPTSSGSCWGRKLTSPSSRCFGPKMGSSCPAQSSFWVVTASWSEPPQCDFPGVGKKVVRQTTRDNFDHSEGLGSAAKLRNSLRAPLNRT